MRKLLTFLKNWNELITLPLALLLWWYSSSILRMIDETAGVYDVGILQAFLLGTAGILFGHALIWLVLRLSYKELYKILDSFGSNNTVTPWQKGLFSLLYWGFLLISWATLVAGMS